MTALTCFMSLYSVGIYLLKLTMEAPEQFVKSIQSSYWRHSDVFIVNFEQISHIVLVFPL